MYKIDVPLFSAAYAAPNKGTSSLYSFSNTAFFMISVTLLSTGSTQEDLSRHN